jgi:hypothetical protein
MHTMKTKQITSRASIIQWHSVTKNLPFPPVHIWRADGHIGQTIYKLLPRKGRASSASGPTTAFEWQLSYRVAPFRFDRLARDTRTSRSRANRDGWCRGTAGIETRDCSLSSGNGARLHGRHELRTVDARYQRLQRRAGFGGDCGCRRKGAWWAYGKTRLVRAITSDGSAGHGHILSVSG